LADANSFEAVAREWLALQKKKLAPATYAKAVWIVETLVFPYIGSRPIAKVNVGLDPAPSTGHITVIQSGVHSFA
jgi:hypothetical protein